MTIPAAKASDPVLMVPVESSNVEAVGHLGGDLHVKFRGGNHYVYAAVPRGLYVAMLGAESVGKFHARHIKDKFEHRKV